MKKKILILAAIAVSGIAAVVASNTNAFVGDAEAHCFEATGKECYVHWCDDCNDFSCANSRFTQVRDHIWCNTAPVNVH